MNLISSFLHLIDIDTDNIHPISISDTPNIKNYIRDLVQEIAYNTLNKRDYSFKEGNTEVKNSLSEIIDNTDTLPKIIKNNARRLLEKEKNAQSHLTARGLGKIQRGSLLHLHFNDDDDSYDKIIICKVEHDEILDEKDFDVARGLNIKKKFFKAILVVFDEQKEIKFTFVFDKNNSKYWWSEFLELQQKYTDADNTEKSLNAIDVVLKKEKTKYYPDYVILKNSVVGYYHNNMDINYYDILDTVIKDYDPIDPEFPKEKIIDKLINLPTKKGFDSQFQVDKKSIKKKIIQRIKLGPSLFLSIDDFVDNLRNIIQPTKDKNGNKALCITTSEGYDQFEILMKKYGR
ncbi:nucleoid-associated protein [Elizabethkingia anophelis]|nr:nucleoid-associated protein [Elizabethkingia anophelis]